jgi:CDP-2,3-bis-(O-geranylgeranyl)-sn-glycerol synthase
LGVASAVTLVKFSVVTARLWKITRLLFLVTLANGVPVIGKKLLGARFSLPVDSGTMAPDHQALFGSSKTLRGVLLSVFLTAAAGRVLGFPFGTAALLGSGTMAGDLFSSFCKRRLRLPTSSQALGLDQIPESLFPLLLCRKAFSLSVVDLILAVTGFFIIEIVGSKVLHRFHLRDQPY